MNQGLGGWPTAQLAAIAVAYINIQDQKAQNTGGGTFTSGAWRQRDLNTVVSDLSNIATLASNQITLPQGTYRCRITCPAEYVSRNQARLQNITDSVTTLLGTVVSSPGGGAAMTTSLSVITGKFTITGTKTFQVQHQCTSTSATNGFGGAANLATEVYTVAEFFKEG